MRKLLRDNGLTLALTALFLLSLAGQVWSGLAVENDQRQEHSQVAVGLLQYLGGGQFLSALFENWESEFLSTGVLVVLAIFLRERGSPESKPVSAPHRQTGTN
jgi:hypothetical protein